MNNLSDDTKITNCLICTLAEKMKDCSRCQFNIGLPFKALQANKVEYPKPLLTATKAEFITSLRTLSQD